MEKGCCLGERRRFSLGIGIGVVCLFYLFVEMLGYIYNIYSEQKRKNE